MNILNHNEVFDPANLENFNPLTGFFNCHAIHVLENSLNLSFFMKPFYGIIFLILIKTLHWISSIATPFMAWFLNNLLPPQGFNPDHQTNSFHCGYFK
jgi:hypothetical protein